MFVTDYVNRGDRTSKVGLGTDVPSKIIRLPLAAYGGEVICQRGAFLAGSHTIDIQVQLQLPIDSWGVGGGQGEFRLLLFSFVCGWVAVARGWKTPSRSMALSVGCTRFVKTPFFVLPVCQWL